MQVFFRAIHIRIPEYIVGLGFLHLMFESFNNERIDSLMSDDWKER